MLETILLSSLVGATLPSWFWGRTHYNKYRTELFYNIKIAQSLGHASALRDHETGAHNYRVAYMASIIGKELRLRKKILQALMKGAFLHDIGKIGIPDKILLKHGPLNDDEWKKMRLHPLLGKELIKDMPWFDDALDIVVHHHEKYDGTGYPDGLKANDIPLNARIFSIIDVFDALISDRPYKCSFSYDKALKIMKDSSGTQFDPKILEIFFKFAPDFADIIRNSSMQDAKQRLEKKRKEIFGL